ncbi:12884_t:CDS:2, partial [Gigaspora margarita]
NSLPSSPLVDIPLRTPPQIPSPAPTTAFSSNPLTRFINFITPDTVYPIHPEETDPVPLPLPLPPPIQNPLPPNNMAQAQALTDAANAINALAVALGQ